MLRALLEHESRVGLAALPHALHALPAVIQHRNKQVGHLWLLQRGYGHQACRIVIGTRHNAYLVFIHLLTLL
ncbi:MAG TPA: hypothetical protein DDW22_01900 [Prevotellaceae bacterium]|nr:hypothetical protein [Prevotellaceae bacterium]